jgi:perosamine synthetase
MSRFIPQYEPVVTKDYISAVAKQMATGWVGPSAATEKFETTLGKITGANHVISTTSGTVAIMMAIESLNLKKGSTILFPAYTFLAGANAARFMGYKVKLVDIRLETLCMDPYAIPDDADISCIMFINHNAYCGPDVKKIKKICKERGIYMIEDSSQALGIKNAGLIGDVGIISFSVPKIVTTGQGGAVITSNIEIAERCKQIRDHGDNWRKDRIHKNLGVNFKFNDILAAYGQAQLDKIDLLLNKRKKVFDEYRKYIKIKDFGYDSTWLVLYKTRKIQEIISELAKHNIQAVQYYKPLTHNPIYNDENTYKNSEKVYKEILYLPSSLNLKAAEIKKICSIINKVENE